MRAAHLCRTKLTLQQWTTAALERYYMRQTFIEAKVGLCDFINLCSLYNHVSIQWLFWMTYSTSKDAYIEVWKMWRSSWNRQSQSLRYPKYVITHAKPKIFFLENGKKSSLYDRTQPTKSKTWIFFFWKDQRHEYLYKYILQKGANQVRCSVYAQFMYSDNQVP
jgi:hypothetical protein